MSVETFNVTNPLKPLILKDPNATLDYSWDWTAWLAEIADTITLFQLIPDPEITVASSAQVVGVITAFLSGGTVDATHRVVCRITTAGGRIDDRSIFLKIKQR